MSGLVSRRQWLRTTGLGVGATAALPGLLPALEASRALGGVSYPTLLAQLERDVTTARRAAGPIRLQFNENPFGMSPKAKDALMTGWAEHAQYMSPMQQRLTETFAKHVGVPAENVLVTQGSSEVLAIAALAYGAKGGDLIVPTPTFEDLPRYMETLGATVHRVPLSDTMEHDLPAMDARVSANTKLVFVCNPNNPTSNLTNESALRDFVTTTAKRAPVVVDEAYHDFVDDPSYRSMTDLVLAGHNIIVSRTASKIHGLAGLRVGFAVARPDILAKLAAYITGSPNAMGLHAANASLQDTAYQDYVKASNREGRTLLLNALAAEKRRVLPSQTNFVFFDAGRSLDEVQRYFLSKHFLVGRAFPPYMQWCRVSIGTPDEMKQFVSVLPGAFSA